MLLALLATHATLASALDNPDQTAPATDAQSDQWADCPDKAPDSDLVPGGAEILRLVPKDTLLLGWYDVDLNLDGKLDALLVVEKSCGEPILQIAIRQRDGVLSVVASNDHLIISRDLGWSYDIETSPGKFMISQHDDGQATRSYEEVTFMWSKKRHTWVVKDAASTTRYLPENSINEEDEKSAAGLTFEEYQNQI